MVKIIKNYSRNNKGKNKGMVLLMNFSTSKHRKKQDHFPFAKILCHLPFSGERKFPKLFQTKTFSLLMENYEIFKNYKTASFSKNRGCPRGVMVKAMDCTIVVCEFILQSLRYLDIKYI